MSNDFKEYKKYIGQGFLTSSKSPLRFPESYPLLLESASGAIVKDTEGVSYVDTTSSLGSILLGYKSFRSSVVPNLPFGSTLELKLAKKLNEFFPFVENWKFLKTGTEACMAAIKIARAFTGRDTVLSAGYHGWSDEFISLLWDTGTVSGIPFTKSHSIQKLDMDNFSRLSYEKVAAVIVEPVELDASEERIRRLKELRKRCSESGTVLIFDEVITALRYKGYSVARHHGITPDLIILGKALGNGTAISAIGAADADILNNDKYFVSGTYCGERLGIMAGLQTLKELQDRGKKDEDLLWRTGQEFKDKFNKTASLHKIDIQLIGYPTRLCFTGNETQRNILWQLAIESNVILGYSIFNTIALASRLPHVMDVCENAMQVMRTTRRKLRGRSPVPAFHRKEEKKDE